MLAQPAELGEIEVRAEAENESKDAPTSFTSAVRPSEKPVPFESVSEFIDSSAGAVSKSLSGIGGFSTVSIRGSSPEQVSVFIDGVKVNTAGSGAFDFSTIPLDSIERIEIIRGGGTAQFGADAIGGVINIITKSQKEGRMVEAFGGGGSFTTIKMGGSYREKFKKNGVSLAWTHMQSAGDFKFKTTGVKYSGTPAPVGGGRVFTRIHNAFISESALAGWRHRFSDSTILTLLNDFFFTDREVPGTEEETTVLPPANPLDARERIYRNTSSANLELKEVFAPPVSLEFGLSNNLDVDIFKDATPAIGNPIDVRTNNYSLGAFMKWQAVIDSGPANQTITSRADYRFDLLTDSSPLANAVLTGRKARHVTAIFLQDELAFLDDRIIVIPAVRYEYASSFRGGAGFKGGLKITPFKFFVIKANIEKSFRYPSFNELYFPDQGYIRGNPDLKKEEAVNLDAGFGIATEPASFEFAYFKNWIANSILFVPISATTIAPVNTYSALTEGVEISVSADPVKFIHASGSYTYLNARYASSRNQLPGRPRHEADCRLELRHEFPKLFEGALFGNYNYRGSLPINQANTVFLAERSTVDAGFSVKFAKYYYVTFEAKNITNVQVYDARGFPLPRRSYFGTLGVKWS